MAELSRAAEAMLIICVSIADEHRNFSREEAETIFADEKPHRMNESDYRAWKEQKRALILARAQAEGADHE